jgi:hypothetical protein
MKTTRKLTGITAIIALIAFSTVLLLAGCSGGSGGKGHDPGYGEDRTPMSADFMIGNLSQLKGDAITAVTITAKPGKTNGNITNIRYDGLETLPTAIGAYPVTFDVTAASGWKAAAGLSAGTLTINNKRIESITELSTYLSGQSNNTKANPYYIALNINAGDFTALKTTLNGAENKYVYLDLSGSNITEIPAGAFLLSTSTWKGCASLAGIIIPDSVTAIKTYTFCGCTNLSSVTIGNNVTAIEYGAFANCASLESITIPNSVTRIGQTAFIGSGLTSITIPDSVTLIQSNAFQECASLVSVTIGSGVTVIGELVFIDCASLESVTIPNSVTMIMAAAFRRCTSLASITIPDSVTSIGGNVFQECTSLANVTFQGVIPSSQFILNAFYGDLHAKFYATNAENGTPGTYTTTAPVGESSVWTKQ